MASVSFWFPSRTANEGDLQQKNSPPEFLDFTLFGKTIVANKKPRFWLDHRLGK